jgi:group I intron endonuclease
MKSIVSGLYMIQNSVNNLVYVGSSRDIHRRWAIHKSQLKHHNHHDHNLRQLSLEHGSEIFQFSILRRVLPHWLLHEEQKLLDELSQSGSLINVSLRACGGDLISKHHQRGQIIEKIRSSLVRHWADVEVRLTRAREYTGSGNPNFGRRWTKSQRREASLRLSGRTISDDTRMAIKIGQKIYWTKERKLALSPFRRGSKNGFYGKVHTAKTRARLSLMTTGRSASNRKAVEINGRVYDSIECASRTLSVPSPTILWRINSTNPKFENWRYATTQPLELLLPREDHILLSENPHI